MPQIGPSFSKELIDAGLGGLPFSWGEDGLASTEQLSAQELADVNAVLAIHNPLTPAPSPPLSDAEALVQDVYVALDPEGKWAQQDKDDAVARIKATFAGRPGEL